MAQVVLPSALDQLFCIAVVLLEKIPREHYWSSFAKGTSPNK